MDGRTRFDSIGSVRLNQLPHLTYPTRTHAPHHDANFIDQVNSDGDVTISNDGATILQKMDVEHQVRAMRT
jgi:hypothetical protein